jgi:hypothetical protein
VLFFFTPDHLSPTGGIKQIYRHVELLERAGIPACVLHTQTGFACRWFEHGARLAYLGETPARRARRWVGSSLRRPYRWPTPTLDLDLYEGRKVQISEGSETYREHRLDSADVLVMPEYLSFRLTQTNIELPMVIFNQGWAPTFRGYGFGEHALKAPYTRPNVLAAVAVSEYVQRYLEYAFEGLSVYRVFNGVDPSLFHPNDSPRYRRIAFMPRRMKNHIEQVINMLVLRGTLEGWELAPISGLSESEVAEVLRQSFVYLSTCREEGFGLPPVEAGMAGCIVVGYTGSGADEYFRDGLCERVDQDDALGFAQAVERTLAWVEADEARAIERGRAFSKFLTGLYSREHEAESVIRVWRAILANA